MIDTGLMGRHSAPDDDSDARSVDTSGDVLVDEDGNAGRHSVSTSDQPVPGSGGGESSLFDLLTDNAALAVGPRAAGDPDLDQPAADGRVVEQPVAEQPAAELHGPEQHGPEQHGPAQPGPEGGLPLRRRHGTRDDIGLIRSHGDVRARVLAGLVVPFIVCIAVLAAVGASGRTWLIWIAVTIFVAGVLAGVFLDIGHKRYPASE